MTKQLSRMKKSPVLGLRENAGIFALLVLMSAFVGAMVGFERSLLTEFTRDLGLGQLEGTLLMVALFGASKAVANLFTGVVLDQLGRKRTLLLGWLLALQVPFLLLHGEGTFLVFAANIALGLSQGFTWSTTVIMKIDLVGPKKRGTAMGLNESAGYLAVGITSFITAWYFEQSGLLYPILYGAIGIGLLALLNTIFFVPETTPWAQLEGSQHQEVPKIESNIFLKTTLKDRNLSSITLAGVVNNANDGILWALLPTLLLTLGHPLTLAGGLLGTHAAVWGLGQLITGPLSNKGQLRTLITAGMVLQGLSLVWITFFPSHILPFATLGAGTALVYPTFMVGISNQSHPTWRPKALSAYRFWRDMGYVFGAFLGYLALQFGQSKTAFLLIALVTVLSGVYFFFRYKDA